MTSILVRRRAVAALLLSLGSGCAPSDQIVVRFSSEPIRKAVNEMRLFAFGADPMSAREGSPPCSQIDPRGLGPGDAEARTGLTPQYRWRGANQTALGEFQSVRKGQYTVVVEGWGPPCKRVTLPARREDDPSCAEPSTTGQPVLRAYYCGIQTLDPGHKLDAIVSLESFARIGSTITFPGLAIVYDAANPLLVVDGLESHNQMYAQLLDETAGGLNGVKLRWSVASGSGSFDFAQPTVTADATPEETPNPQHGISAAVLHAGVSASSVEGGKIMVSAYAPGFDGAPLLIEARALRGVEIDISTFDLPRDRVDLSGASFEYQPIAVDDLNGDGILDVATIGGLPGRCNGDGTQASPAAHRLVVMLGTANGGLTPAFSGPINREVTALKTARVDRSGRKSLIAFTRDYCPGRIENTAAGPTFVAKGPRIEVWTDLAITQSDATITSMPMILSEVLKCNGASCAMAPLTKHTIALDAADIDGDGIDEIAVSRCSYIRRASGGQLLDINCHGLMADLSDSEVALLTVELAGSQFAGFRERAAIVNRGLDGGFREVRFADVNGDGSLDLVFATDTQVAGLLGRKNMPDTGFGFAIASRFEESASFSHVFSLGTGHFNDPRYADALVAGGYRLSSSIAGIKLLVGGSANLESGRTTVAVGPPTDGRLLLLRVADLNADGRDDALVLHRETRELQVYLGGGTKLLAAGPAITIPSGVTGEIDVRIESPGDRQTAVAAISAPNDNRLFIARIRPHARGN